MKIVLPSVELLETKDEGGYKYLKRIERAGRICYKSEERITDNSSINFVKMLLKNGHDAMIEHGPSISIKFICDRGISHQIVRHRLFSMAQESSRYCDYSKDKFGKELTFIKPCFWSEDSKYYDMWKTAMQESENTYLSMMGEGATAEMARSVLPQSLKTELIVTGNPRQWRHFFKLRVDKHAHIQMRELAIPALGMLKEWVPVIFDDIIVV